MTPEREIELQPPGNRPSEAFLIDLVVNGVTSEHSRRSYTTGLRAFFTWIRIFGAGPAFTKALVQQYRSSLLDQGLSASTVNLRLSPIRKLARGHRQLNGRGAALSGQRLVVSLCIREVQPQGR
ncbi:phage integrase family protein (plasmid) [Acidisarcina polymorpha]|uniref:Phage integrase family protein n=2 Tax=Acidisarcina polymorpha TaxID=2211140 RepID=A0A2Z5GAB3_9BACT|nr:phage integrase family protein [Acidisarcina polymorpha]